MSVVIKQLLTLQYLEQMTNRLLWVKVQKEMLWQPWQYTGLDSSSNTGSRSWRHRQTHNQWLWHKTDVYTEKITVVCSIPAFCWPPLWWSRPLEYLSLTLPPLCPLHLNRKTESEYCLIDTIDKNYSKFMRGSWSNFDLLSSQNRGRDKLEIHYFVLSHGCAV